MNEKQASFYKDKDILGQDKQVEFIRSEDITEEKIKNIYANEYELPTIKTRYFSMLIDMIIIILLFLGIAWIFEIFENVPDYMRALMFVIVVILYEPILVSTGCTIGQLLTNIRVRRFKNPAKKIWFISAFFRIIVKALLGWVSFITVTFNINRRAIHDFASGTIVIVPKK